MRLPHRLLFIALLACASVARADDPKAGHDPEFGGNCAMSASLGVKRPTSCAVVWISPADKLYCFGVLQHTPDRVVVVDKLTYAGNLLSLEQALKDPRVVFVQADIADAAAMHPAKAAHAIIAAVEAPEPPSLLVLGQDAVDGFRGVLDAQRAELEAWERVSVSTGFDDPA